MDKNFKNSLQLVSEKIENSLDQILTISKEGDKILNEAKNWAHELSKKPTLAIGITKADMIHSMDNDLNATIAFEAVKQIDAFKSYDLKEGVTAFIEKRPAKFKGK